MAIAFDAASNGTDNSPNSSPMTLSHTCTGSDRFLVVGLYTAASNSRTTSVTYNGVAMTQAIKNENNPSGETTEIWYLMNPASGANNIVITLSTDTPIEVCAASYTGVLGGLDNSAVASNTSTTSFAGSVTTVADNCWYVMFARNNADVYGSGAGTTRRANQGACSICDGNAAKTPAGSATLTLTVGGSYAHGGSLLSMSPTAAAAAATGNFFLMFD